MLTLLLTLIMLIPQNSSLLFVSLLSTLPTVHASTESTIPTATSITATTIAAVITLITTINILNNPPAPIKLKINSPLSPETTHYNIIYVKGDGNCYFRAICKFIPSFNYTDENRNHLKLRLQLIQHLKDVYQNPHHALHQTYTNENFKSMIFLNNDNLEDFLERYARHSTEEGWGGLSDSIFMADLLNIKICILDKTSKVMHEFNPTFPNENTIVAFLLAEPNHYRAMIPKLAKPISTTTQTKCNYTYHKINKQTHLVNTPPITSPTPLPMPPLTIKMTIDKQTEFHHSTQKQNHKQLNILGLTP